MVAANTGHAEIDELLERAGVKRRMRLVVPHFIAVGHILQSTDLIATLPERFAERCRLHHHQQTLRFGDESRDAGPRRPQSWQQQRDGRRRQFKGDHAQAVVVADLQADQAGDALLHQHAIAGCNQARFEQGVRGADGGVAGKRQLRAWRKNTHVVVGAGSADRDHKGGLG